jgi:transposase
MRKSFNGLYGIVSQQLGKDPTSGHIFVFCNRARNRIKLLIWDGSGLWICAKRLEQGRFGWDWPEGESSHAISHESLSLLLGGIDLQRTRAKKWYRKQASSG